MLRLRKSLNNLSSKFKMKNIKRSLKIFNRNRNRNNINHNIIDNTDDEKLYTDDIEINNIGKSSFTKCNINLFCNSIQKENTYNLYARISSKMVKIIIHPKYIFKTNLDGYMIFNNQHDYHNLKNILMNNKIDKKIITETDLLIEYEDIEYKEIDKEIDNIYHVDDAYLDLNKNKHFNIILNIYKSKIQKDSK